MSTMQRREFCRFMGACALCVAGVCLPGCARALDWSDARRSGSATQRTMSGSAEPTGSANASGTVETTATDQPSVAPTPDIALYRGTDPATNVAAAIAALGGMERFVKRGDKVAIKPNVLTARGPEYAATTNPDVVAAVVRLAYEAGAAEVVVFDRPTAPPRQAYDVSGIAAAVEAADGRMKVLADRDFERVEIPGGRSLESWPLAVDVFDADVFINIPIAKTHGLAGLTMSMKNLMGIMGATRGQIHQGFDQKIVDINSLVRPHLIVLDAWRQLMRNGPTGGSLADVADTRAVIVGTNAASVDAVGTTLFDRTPTQFKWLQLAAEQGLGEIDLRRLAIQEGRS